jgi:tetraacyldisaccharide 4'-kinase
VVSIGNLTLGGTGKTPCVEYVAALYRRHRLRVAILSRGYGSRGGRNDEALVLEENLPEVPHLQGEDRAALAQEAVDQFQSEVLVLDDGFQHRRLERDLDVVLLDATNPWGYGHLFPRGLLREPPKSLRRAGVIVLTRCDQVDDTVRRRLRERVTSIAVGLPIVETSHRAAMLIDGDRQESIDVLKGRPVAAFCGIGNPNAFQQTLANLGARVTDFRIFPDHHAYGPPDIEELERWAARQTEECIVVTTQKDLVKLRVPQLGGRPLFALRIAFHIDAGRELFDRKLLEIVSKERH